MTGVGHFDRSKASSSPFVRMLSRCTQVRPHGHAVWLMERFIFMVEDEVVVAVLRIVPLRHVFSTRESVLCCGLFCSSCRVACENMGRTRRFSFLLTKVPHHHQRVLGKVIAYHVITKFLSDLYCAQNVTGFGCLSHPLCAKFPCWNQFEPVL